MNFANSRGKLNVLISQSWFRLNSEKSYSAWLRHKILRFAFLLTALAAFYRYCWCQEAKRDNGASHDRRLVGTWTLTRSYLTVSRGEKIHALYVRKYSCWEFKDNGRLSVKIDLLAGQIEKQFRWQTKVKDGNQILELYAGDEIYLVAKILFNKDELWIGFSLDPKRIKNEPPKTFDLEKEPSMLLVILKGTENAR